MDVDLESAFDIKMDKIMKRSAIRGDLGIRVTDYKSKIRQMLNIAVSSDNCVTTKR